MSALLLQLVKRLDENGRPVVDERQEAADKLDKVLDKLFRLVRLHAAELHDQQLRQDRVERRTVGETQQQQKKQQQRKTHNTRTRNAKKRKTMLSSDLPN